MSDVPPAGESASEEPSTVEEPTPAATSGALEPALTADPGPALTDPPETAAGAAAEAEAEQATPVPSVVDAPAEAPAVVLAPPVQGAAAPVARRRGRRWIAVALVVIFILAAGGGGGAYFANASLSRTYSPEQALLNYFAAQARGDVASMQADANFLRGDGSFDQFFNKDGLAAMMAIDQNKAITDVKVTSTKAVDASTVIVTASMMWGGSSHTSDYTVHKNLADTHYVFYNSWKLDIPFRTISFTLPNQAGPIQVDGLELPDTAATSVQVIAGFHNVEMASTPFYDKQSKLLNVVDGFGDFKVDGTISTSAHDAAAAAIRAGANVCDAGRYTDCPGHTYHSAGAAYTIYFLEGLPGYPNGIQYNYYVFIFSRDITTGMTLQVPKEQGLMYASGTCGLTMTVDGSRTYQFTGDWSANLTWSNGAFKADVYPNCEKAKA